MHTELAYLEAICSGTYMVAWDEPVDRVVHDLNIPALDPAHGASVGWFGPLTPYVTPTTDVTDVFIAPSEGGTLCVAVRRRAIPYPVIDIPVLHPTWAEWLQDAMLARIMRPRAFTEALDRERMGVEGSFVHNGVIVRFVLTRPPITPIGPTVTLRLLPQAIAPSLDSYLNGGTLTLDAIQVVKKAFVERGSFLVAGSTGSGKTTFLTALLTTGRMLSESSLARSERYVVIEDTEEIGWLPGSVSMVVPDGFDVERAFAEAIRMSLRMRPDRIVVGEVRGSEAASIIHAAMTGHPVLATIHGTDAASAVDQLIQYASRNPKLTPGYVRGLLSQSVKASPWIVIVMQRLKVMQIAEILPFGAQSDRIPLNMLFRRETLDEPLQKQNAPQGPWAVKRRP